MANILYLDFDLQIECADQGYRAQIVNSPTGQASQTFTLPFSDAELEKFLVLAGRPRAPVRNGAATDVAAAQDFGGRLFETLFNKQTRDGLQSSLNEAERQGKGLRIRLRFNDAPELADIPWEYLYRADADRFLALSANTPLVRYLELPGLIRPLTVTPPLRILVVLASPSDYPPLNLEAEWNLLHAALQNPESRGLVTVDRLDHATIATLQTKLRQADYHVFHFLGHGGFDAQSQDGILMLEDAQGNGSPTSGRDLGVLLPDHRTLRLALLNTCEAGRSGRKNLFDGVAQTLVRQGIPAVIAMQFPVTDQAAIILATAFYSALADGYPVDAALAVARKQLFIAGDNLEWGTPVLYLRTPDGQIFDFSASATVAAPATSPPTPAEVAIDEPPTPAATLPPVTLAVAAVLQSVAPVTTSSEWHEVMLLDRHAGPVNRATFSPDGKRIVTSGGDHTARVWNAATGKQGRVLRDPNHTETAAAFSPDGTLLATVGGYVRIWRVRTWRALDIQATQLGAMESSSPNFGGVMFSPDGTQLATWAAVDLSLWAVGTWERTLQLENPADIADIAFSPDGSAIATALKDQTARVWDLKTADTVGVLRGHMDQVSSVAYSYDGRLIVTASADKTARIWDATTEQTLLALNGHAGAVYTAVFSPNGKQILTTSADDTAQIWDASTGANVAVLRTQGMLSTIFSPDRDHIITTGKDGTARVWSKAHLKTR